MKKLLSLILIAALLLSASGCGAASQEAISQTSQPEETTQETEAVTETTEYIEQTLPALSQKGQIQPTVLWDSQGTKITAQSLDYTSSTLKLNLLLENNSGKPLSFICQSLGYSCNAVNGYLVSSGYVNADLEPGTTAEETVSIEIA